MQEQDDAKETLIKYFMVLNDFQDILAKIKSGSVSYLSYIMSFLNLKFNYPISDGHFYHFISEAWLLSVFHSLKNQYMKELEDNVLKQEKCNLMVLNKSYKEIITDIQLANIDINFFIDSLEILLGTFKIHDPVIKVTQMKLSQLYLKKINIAKVEHMDIPDTLTKQQFEKLLFTFMLYGLGYTLNELDPSVTDKNSKILIDSYTKIDNTDEFEITFEKYVEELNKQLGRKMAESEIEILNTEQTFFNFAKYKFDDMLSNVKVFNTNIGNPELLLFELSLDSIRKIISNARDFTRFVIKNSEIRLVTSYLYKIAEFFYGNKFIIPAKAVTSIMQLKEWVNKGLDSDYIKDNKMYQFLNEKKDYISNIVTNFNLFTNVKNLIVFTTGTSYNVMMNISSWSKEAISKFTEVVKHTLFDGLATVKNNVFGGDPMFKISSDNENYLHLEIRKNLPFNKSKLYDLLNDLISKFKAFDLIDYTKRSAEYLVIKFKAIIGNDYPQMKVKQLTPHTANIQVELSSSLVNTPK
jgi:hypothetical protein